MRGWTVRCFIVVVAVVAACPGCAADPGSPLRPDDTVAVTAVTGRGICMCATCFPDEFCQVTDTSMFTGELFIGRDACDLIETTLGLTIDRAHSSKPSSGRDRSNSRPYPFFAGEIRVAARP